MEKTFNLTPIMIRFYGRDWYCNTILEAIELIITLNKDKYWRIIKHGKAF